MRMPPYMRDELGTALSLTRRQYLLIISYLDALTKAQPKPAGPRAKARRGVETLTGTWWKIAREVGEDGKTQPIYENTPLRRRVHSVLDKLHKQREPKKPEPER